MHFVIKHILISYFYTPSIRTQLSSGWRLQGFKTSYEGSYSAANSSDRNFLDNYKGLDVISLRALGA